MSLVALCQLRDAHEREQIIKDAYIHGYTTAFNEQQFKLSAILLRKVDLGQEETHIFVDALYSFWKMAYFRDGKTEAEKAQLLKFVRESFLSLFDERSQCQQYVSSTDCIKLSHIFVGSKV